MKKVDFCFIFLFLLLLGCTNRQSKENKTPIITKEDSYYNNIVINNDIDNIVFYSEDIEVETSFNIQCNDFLNTFSDIDSYSINNRIEIDEFINELKRTNLADKNSAAIDTRYIVKIQYKNGSNEILCGDRFNIQFRNKIYKASPIIISKIYSHSNNLLDIKH